MESALDGEDVHFTVRRNWGQDGTVVQWPDSSCDDYIFRSNSLDNECLYSFVRHYEKKYMTYKEMDRESNELRGVGNDGDGGDLKCDDEQNLHVNSVQSDTSGGNDTPKQRFQFTEFHPGAQFSYMTRLKHAAVPKIFMTRDKLCDIELLEIWNSEPNAETARRREDYAKYALMLFYPFRDLGGELKDVQSQSYWEKFKKEYIASNLDATGGFWFQGKTILQNMQDRLTNQKKMRRPQDPLVAATNTPEAQGKMNNKGRSEFNDGEDTFDIDINCLGIDDTTGFDASDDYDDSALELIQKTQLRNHEDIIGTTHVRKDTVTCPKLDTTLLWQVKVFNSPVLPRDMK